MNPYILIVIILGIGLGYIWSRHKAPITEGATKVLNKGRILEALHGDDARITNDEVEKMLGVSDATATRYLEELEQEGELRQVGEEGRGVYYTRAK